MSIFNNKANYHPGTQLSCNYPTGSYKLPGNEYYSVIGTAPRLQTNHNANITDPKYKYSQSYRIDPVDSLLKLKQETSLTRYHHHNPPVEHGRDKYLFVPTYLPRDEPNYLENPELTQFKQIAENKSEYKLNQISKLPELDYNVLPERNLNDECYRLYGARNPYDMMVLRDTSKYNYENLSRMKGTDPNFVSSSTIPRP